MTNLFIGVVSHQGTRFPASQGPDGLAARLSSRLGELGLTSELHVSTRDAYTSELLPITQTVVRRSIGAQMSLMYRWSRYLDAGRSHLTSIARAGAQSVVMGFGLWRRAAPPLGSASKGESMIRRLVNIELAHIDLLRSGLAADADWILILEDDAETTDVNDAAAGLAALVGDASAQASYINLSQSHTYDELGIGSLMTPADQDWRGSTHRMVEIAARPITNTVCAIAYRRDFAGALLAYLDAIPVDPVLPIDWKLNLALMRMHAAGDFRAHACWCVEPGPFVQRSMLPADAAH